jgi:hypothetical protein
MENAGISYGHFVCFIDILYIELSFGILFLVYYADKC